MTDTHASSEANGHEVFTPKPSMPAPIATTGVIGWLRSNLFSSYFNGFLTLGSVYLIYLLFQGVFHWGFETAVWTANTRRECLNESPTGACWAGVGYWFGSFVYGRYPSDQIWRINLSWVLFALWMAPLWFPKVSFKPFIGLSAVLIYPFLAGYLYLGGDRNWFMAIMVAIAIMAFIICWLHVACCLFLNRSFGDLVISITGFTNKPEKTHKFALLAVVIVGFAVVSWFMSGWELMLVGPNKWGGLFLTLVISGIGIASALPIGIVAALGRRSKMPVIRVVTTAYIELFRSVPLITVLFMATTMFPLFLPEGIVLNKLASAIVAVCLFSGAYMAETVRGGLQAIDKGQYEASAALGLGFWQTTSLIIMPQALKLMIPNIVGSFIGLFKDTTLVAIIGLYDLLGMVKAVSHDPKWIGLHTEPLVAASLIYFIGCFAMSRYSQHLEKTLGQGDRR
jgi:general L-amino acid transport system permease protein